MRFPRRAGGVSPLSAAFSDPRQGADAPRSPGRKLLVGYVAGITLGAVMLVAIRSAGANLAAPEIASAPPVGARGGGSVDVVLHVLTTLAAVIGLGFLLGRALKWVGQPPVIGEVLAGIVLGPSLLGAISPQAMHLLIPDAAADPGGKVRAALGAIGQIGVVLYMFLVGLELNAAQLKDHAHAAVAISHFSILVPFVLGCGLALWLYPILSHAGVPFLSFALFLGAALSVTAFPVLARILADRKLDRTPMGVLALGCAAADDVTAWCLLALVVGVAKASVGAAIATAGLAAVFIAAIFLVVRPAANRVCHALDARNGPLPPAAVPILFVAILVAALTTEAIGVHAVIGAFLLGAAIPHESRVAREVTHRLKDVVTVLLLPAFFALSGLRTEIGLLGSGLDWLICLAIVAVATVGKVGGTVLASRLADLDWRSSLALGAMMNTRGLMALIVLDVGLKEGVITPTLYTMMVLMALVTTLMTAPTLRRVHDSGERGA